MRSSVSQPGWRRTRDFSVIPVYHSAISGVSLPIPASYELCTAVHSSRGETNKKIGRITTATTRINLDFFNEHVHEAIPKTCKVTDVSLSKVPPSLSTLANKPSVPESPSHNAHWEHPERGGLPAHGRALSVTSLKGAPSWESNLLKSLLTESSLLFPGKEIHICGGFLSSLLIIELYEYDAHLFIITLTY